MKNSNDTIGNRTRDPRDCSAVPQRTTVQTVTYILLHPQFPHLLSDLSEIRYTSPVNISDFRENRCTEGRTFVTGVIKLRCPRLYSAVSYMSIASSKIEFSTQYDLVLHLLIYSILSFP